MTYKQLADMPGLGAKSQSALQQVGIETPAQLKDLGPILAYWRLYQQSNGQKPSMNFLYALVGAVENRHWTDVARNDKEDLLMALEGLKELQNA